MGPNRRAARPCVSELLCKASRIIAGDSWQHSDSGRGQTDVRVVCNHICMLSAGQIRAAPTDVPLDHLRRVVEEYTNATQSREPAESDVTLPIKQSLQRATYVQHHATFPLAFPCSKSRLQPRCTKRREMLRGTIGAAVVATLDGPTRPVRAVNIGKRSANRVASA